MAIISSLLYFIIILLLTLVFMATTFVVWVISYPFGKKINAHLTCQSTRIWYAIVYYCGWPWGWRIKTEGKENVPKEACIFMSNHQGYFDIPIFLCLNKTLRWVSKKEVLKFPIVGQVLYMRGDILVDRGNGASAKHMIELCKKNLEMGISVVIYPEGTRTKTGDIGSFKAGGFLLAKQCGCPIVPSVIVGNYECIKDKRVHIGNKFILKFLSPITPETISNTDIKELTRNTQELIINEYEKIRNIN